MVNENEKSGCVLGATNLTKILTLEVESEKHEKAIHEIQKRPPVWATTVISLLSFLLGCSVTALITSLV